MRKFKLIIAAILSLFIIYGCTQDMINTPEPQQIEPPEYGEPMPYVNSSGETDTIVPDTNRAYLPGCDEGNGWAMYVYHSVEMADRSYAVKAPQDDSMYRITYADKPNHHFKGQLYAVWDYTNGYYYSPVDSGHVTCQDTFNYPNGTPGHVVMCTFSGFTGFSDCP